MPAHQRRLLSQLPRQCPHQAFAQTELVAKGTPSSSGPSGDTQRKSLLKAEGHKVEGYVWEVVGSQLYSPQVRILILWTERQTDRWTPHPHEPCFPGSPRASCLSHFGDVQKVWPQALGPGEWEAWALLPHPHTSIYVQGHNDTDMYKYTQACTHAHKYTHTHKHVPFYRQPLHPGITG